MVIFLKSIGFESKRAATSKSLVLEIRKELIFFINFNGQTHSET